MTEKNQALLENLGQTLRFLRSTRGFKQGAVGSVIDLSQPAYSRLENDPSQLTLEKFIALAELYKMSPDKMLGFNTEAVINTIQENSQTGNNLAIINNGTMNNSNPSIEERLKAVENALAEILKKL